MKPKPTFDEEYDVIIVGAGSAGCVVAARLSEETKLTIALIEAGDKDRNPWFHIPIGFGKTLMNPRYTWGYRTEPDPGIGGRALPFVRGKVLGGSGSINGLVFLRGGADDYDSWERSGAKGWSYRDVLPYFRKMERAAGGDDSAHGRDGPITIAVNPRASAAARAFVESCRQLQFARNNDFNNGTIDGAGFVPLNVNGRWRHSTASAYLKPSLTRRNLDILSSTHVTRILFDGKRAIGVEAIADGRTIRLAARREVVLSGGAINSPTLLMSSGIGPADELAAVGVPILRDAPNVGKNLQDHINVGFVYRSKLRDSVNLALTSRTVAARMMLQWFLRKAGPMAGGAVEAVLFARSNPGVQTPDLHFHLMNFSRNPVDCA